MSKIDQHQMTEVVEQGIDHEVIHEKLTIEEILINPKFSRKEGKGIRNYCHVNLTKIEKLITNREFRGWRAFLKPLLPPSSVSDLDSSSIRNYKEKARALFNNKKLIEQGGDPLVPESKGGLRLEFIYRHITNSGNTLTKKNNPPKFFSMSDENRNISQAFIRIYRVVNEC